ncbi:MAG: aspartate-semialdehyde dehydrogenase [Methylococcaceae bacterium]|nr:aspartate-semialdehyde dehydrogenase [Methylococcaceae bacterium]
MELSALTQTILQSVRKDQFCGFDPFDGLNSTAFNRSPFYKSEWMRLAWLQFHKRSTINFRPLIGVPKKRNPKGMGLFILGLLEDYARTQESQYLQDAIELGDWLLTQQSDPHLWQHACWGYHFDWQARAFYVPVGKPNIITTVYVSRALYALWEVTDNDTYKNIALDSANFIVQTLHTQHDGHEFFAYIPGETTFVHNASLWGAAWVAFVASKTANAEMAQLALTVAQQSVNAQKPNGAWVYGTLHHHQFIDGFHTGYNLEALTLLKDSLKTDRFDQTISQGYEYYKLNFFEADGAVKYYHNNRYPLDMHCVAQAIFTLIKVGGQPEDFALVQKIMTWSIAEMYLPAANHFCYQKTQWLTNKINYTRWTQAWCYYGFAFYNRVLAEKP